MIREAMTGLPAYGDLGAVVLVRVLINLLMVGGRRLRHVGFLHDDPLVQRFCDVRVLPTARTVSRWLQGFTMITVERVQHINTVVVNRVLATLNALLMRWLERPDSLLQQN